MTSPITLIQEYYYMSNDLTKLLPVFDLKGFDLKMACAKKIGSESLRNRGKICATDLPKYLCPMVGL